MKLAISGKGGTGKTTIACSLARVLARRGGDVIAIDADPDANLAAMMGIQKDLTPLSNLREVISERVGGKEGFFKVNPEVDDVIADYSVEAEGVRVLQMGAIKRANSSCYCPENSFLRAVINTLVFRPDQIVILDMGAGIEHLTRGTSQGVDRMLIICQPDRISLKTAQNIESLALEAGISRVTFVGNMVRSKEEKEFLNAQLPDSELVFIDHDPNLLMRDFGKDEGNVNLLGDKVIEAAFGDLIEQIKKEG